MNTTSKNRITKQHQVSFYNTYKEHYSKEKYYMNQNLPDKVDCFIEYSIAYPFLFFTLHLLRLELIIGN